MVRPRLHVLKEWSLPTLQWEQSGEQHVRPAMSPLSTARDNGSWRELAVGCCTAVETSHRTQSDSLRHREALAHGVSPWP